MHPPDRALNDAEIRATIASLTSRLAHAGPLETSSVVIPRSQTTVTVTRPTDTNLLLDQVADDPEQNLPYWSEIWPSGIALAADILRHPERIKGKRVLELGSGLGITAAVALANGANLTVTDYAPESLILTHMTCLAHTGMQPAASHRINWRTPDVAELARDDRFDVVLAADALYERRDIEPLIAAVETLVTADGAIWLAEPGRKPAAIFLAGMEARGWQRSETRWTGPWPDPADEEIEVGTHWLRRQP